MPTASKLIDELCSTLIHPSLSNAGFVRHGRTWNRAVDQMIDVLEIQVSRWTTEGKGSFTLNVGVFEPAVHRLVWGTHSPAVVREADCIARARIGRIPSASYDPRQRDLWWDIGIDCDVDQVGKDVVDKVSAWALPFLEGMHSFSALHDFMVSAKAPEGETPAAKLYLAVVKTKVGRSDEALHLLIGPGGLVHGPWAERATRVADQLGLSRPSTQRLP